MDNVNIAPASLPIDHMSADYGNAGPGGPAKIHYPQGSDNPARTPWLQPAPLEENALQPPRTRGATSQLGKSKSVLDWLEQGASEAAGKNLVPMKRPERGTHNDNRTGPFGPPNAFVSTTTQGISPANINPTGILAKNAPPSFQRLRAANTQAVMPTGAGHPASNLVQAITQNPLPPLKHHPGAPPPQNIQPTPRPRRMVFDAVHDPSNPSKKDVMFRVSIPIEEDFQASLEEFCRLRRLGRFRDAEQQFEHKLNHLQGMPYVLIQYCEMLLAAGRFKSFRAVPSRKKYISLESEESVRDPSLDMLEGNFWLLDRLAKVPLPHSDGDIFQVIHGMLWKLRSESAMGSTAIQILVLCLTILDHLRASLSDPMARLINDYYFNQLFDWNRLYHRLLGESRIWDLRDLLVAAVYLFPRQFLYRFLNVKSFPLALDRLLEDWIQPEYDESTSLGLLDLFTSLLLNKTSFIYDEPNAALLLEHSKSLAESIQAKDPENMRSRPFIQWIIVKAISEMGDIPMRPDGLALSGIIILQGPGQHLPVYIPAEPWEKANWDMVSGRSSPQHLQALQVALQAARSIGDHRLETTCLRLLILRSREPMFLMDELASIQFEQGDAEGFLETCLSKYIALDREDEAARVSLISDFKKLGTILPDRSGIAQPEVVYTPASFCEPSALLLWTRDVITKLITTDHPENGYGSNTFLRDNAEFWNGQLIKYGSRLPRRIAEVIQRKFGVRIPPPIRIPMAPGPPDFIKLSPTHQIPQPGQPGRQHLPQQHHGVKEDIGTAIMPGGKQKKAKVYVRHGSHKNTRQRRGGRRPTSSGFSDDTGESDFTFFTVTSSGVSRGARYYGHRRHRKKPEAPDVSESEDFSGHSTGDNASSLFVSKSLHSDDNSPKYGEVSLRSLKSRNRQDGGKQQLKRTMSPDIKVSREGRKHNLKIVSDLFEANDISIVMTNKADATTSKVYTIKNGVVSKKLVTDSVDSDGPGGGGEVQGSSSRPRAMSQSSLQTVRPFKTIQPKDRRPSPYVTHAADGLSPTIREEDEAAADDKPTKRSTRVHKANKYMNRKTDKWRKNHKQGDNAASSSKPRRSSIIQPKPVRPAAPRNLVGAISTDEEDGHEDNTKRGARKARRFTQASSSKKSKRDPSSATSEDAGFASNEAVRPSDSASVSFDSSAEATEGENYPTDRKGKRPADASRSTHKARRKDERGDEGERLVGGWKDMRTHRSGVDLTPETLAVEVKRSGAGAGTGVDTASHASNEKKGKKVDRRDGKKEDREKQRLGGGKKAAVEEATVGGFLREDYGFF